jgi:hypothetical protein
MDPIQININVELGPKAARALEALLGAQQAPADKPSAPIEAKTILEPDMPDFTGEGAAPEAEEISDADLRQVVKAAKDRVGAKPIRDVFASMDISSSVECPQERRSELVAKLNKLN